MLYDGIKQEELIGGIINEFKKADESEYIAIYNKYIPYLWVDRSAYTARNLYQSVLTALKASKMAKAKKEKVEKFFTLPTSFFLALNKQSEAKEINRINEKIEFSIDSHISRMIALKNDIVEKKIRGFGVQSDEQAIVNASVVYLAMATGRRTHELVKTIKVQKVKGKVYFSGIAKKKKIDSSGLYPAILLDDDYDFIKRTIAKVQKYFDFAESTTATDINAKTAVVLNRAVSKFTGDKTASMHTLRERYAEICVSRKCPENMDPELFREFVLGHETKLKASDFYKTQKGV